MQHHISDVHDHGTNSERARIATEFLAQGRKTEIKKAIEGLIDDEFDALQDHADEYISQVAADRAEKFLSRVLQGDEDAAMALLGDSLGGGRYRKSGYDEGTPWAHLIHGRLFETQQITLRRQIVEAHAELLRNERIADLESVVDGLTRQVQELTTELEQCRDRLR